MSDQKTDKPAVESQARIMLDLATLEQRALHLPESMREPFIWLGRYTDEQCHRDLDILHAKFKALKIEHDKTTWSKILRGFWNRSSAGHEVPPCLQEEKFLKAVTMLKQDARIKELGGRIPFVMTPTAKMIFDYIDAKRAPDRVNKFGVIIGETGSQKSATTGEYTSRNNHGLCIKVEAPETPSMAQFMTDVAKCYGYSGQASYLRKKSYVLDVFSSARTIIVENIQRLFDPRAGDRQPIFSFLQKLQEDANGTIILTLTPTFEQMLTAGKHRGFFEQFEGRAGGRRTFLRLPAYPPEEDVVMIARAFGLSGLNERTTWLHPGEKQEKVTVTEYLNRIAHEDGRIRRIFEDLQGAKIEAEAAKEKLTIDHIRAFRGED